MEIQQAIDDFILYLEVEQNYSVHTLRSYDYDLRVLLSFLKLHQRSTRVEDLNPSVIRRFIQDQVKNQGAKPRTLQRRISTLKSWSNFCTRENIIPTNFMIGIVAPKTDSKLPVYMNMEELKNLFRSLEVQKHPLALRNETMVKLLATTGMRRQELCDLTWEQIDLYNETIRIYGKGKKERLLPLHASVIPLLKKYQVSQEKHQIHGTEHVFRNKNGYPLNSRGLHVIFKKALQTAGLPPARFSLHHLRHTFATLLLQHSSNQTIHRPGHALVKEKVDLKTLQELLGHESLATTQVYTHIDFESKKKAIDSFPFE